MSDRRKSSGDRKAEIVEATLRLLTVTPVEALSTARIADDIGITQAAIFRHFRTKDALWAAVLEAVEARAVSAWDAAEEGQTTPLARLRAVLRAQLGLIA
ncbi:helix-turn-helix transcriptional regulator [Roseovarius sp. A21]|uniref:Helix-turn-helix transcriptional regulator n=1 Tax=Roseovarius bejariae TaxID=2576383 RepID=A0A844CVJ7_9RHOB|nr:helix-turn-helix domain-containing protein [Roseovarius bejariae]MRU14700.1 helix-turn-helix transcriptional regulator [Roseovarius bejariae]